MLRTLVSLVSFTLCFGGLPSACAPAYKTDVAKGLSQQQIQLPQPDGTPSRGLDPSDGLQIGTDTGRPGRFALHLGQRVRAIGGEAILLQGGQSERFAWGGGWVWSTWRALLGFGEATVVSDSATACHIEFEFGELLVDCTARSDGKTVQADPAKDHDLTNGLITESTAAQPIVVGSDLHRSIETSVACLGQANRN